MELKNNVISLLEKLKKDKKVILILVLTFLGMIMILFSENDKSEIKTETETTYISAKETETKLENLIGKINGAGKVRVMITYENSEEKIFAKDSDEKIRNEERNQNSEHIIIKEEDGENGLIIKTIYPKIRGVAVVCDGASNSVVKEQIVSVVTALFDINSNSISVVNMEN